MRCRVPSKPQVNQLLDLWPHKIVWVLFQEPDNTMVVSFADAADHGATTLTATADPWIWKAILQTEPHAYPMVSSLNSTLRTEPS